MLGCVYGGGGSLEKHSEEKAVVSREDKQHIFPRSHNSGDTQGSLRPSRYTWGQVVI